MMTDGGLIESMRDQAHVNGQSKKKLGQLEYRQIAKEGRNQKENKKFDSQTATTRVRVLFAGVGDGRCSAP